MATTALKTTTAEWRDYLALCKPNVVALIVFTAVVGMLLASPGMVPLDVLILGNLGIALCAGAAAAVLWVNMFHREYGVVNRLLSFFGILPVNWLDEQHAFITVVLMPTAGHMESASLKMGFSDRIPRIISSALDFVVVVDNVFLPMVYIFSVPQDRRRQCDRRPATEI